MFYDINTSVSLIVTGRWFSPAPPVSSINKTDRHDITEILLKVALNTIKQANKNPVLSVCIYIVVKSIDENYKWQLYLNKRWL